MKLLDNLFDLEKQIHNYFGYVENWVKIPLDDCTEFYWHLTGDGSTGDAEVLFQEGPLKAGNLKDAIYGHSIYTQRFLPKWVYRGEEYTMIVVDTETDGNKFLSVFDNKKEFRG